MQIEIDTDAKQYAEFETMKNELGSQWTGIAPYRFDDNPLELRFALAWQKVNVDYATLDYLVGNQAHAQPCSDEERTTVCTVIQWLGSPIGQCFLRDVLCGENECDIQMFERLLHSAARRGVADPTL